jgi:hypothetical protein
VNARAWIAHFLSDRKFAVKVNGVLSDFFDVLSGVSQGSELGPKLSYILLIFLVYFFRLVRCSLMTL